MCCKVLYCHYGVLMATYMNTQQGGPLWFREDKGSALAVTLATEACPDAEETRRCTFLLERQHSGGPHNAADWNAGS